jgi:hypothetical protein
MTSFIINKYLHSLAKFLKTILPPPIYKLIINLYIVFLKFINFFHILFQNRFRVFRTGPYPIQYYPDGMWTYAANSFDDDPRFKAAWERIRRHVGNIRIISWRLHVVLALAEYCSHLEGDFVECGTYRGINAHGISAFLDFKNIQKNFYLFDTWTGLAEERLHSFEKMRAVRRYEDCYNEVKETFSDIPNVILIQGLVPDTLSKVKWKKVCFLHIDMNCVYPEEAALEYFWDKIVTGGVIISDDYSHPGYEDQKKAFDSFAKSKNAMVFSLPTGTGVIFKR